MRVKTADYNLFKKESERHCVCVDVCVSVSGCDYSYFFMTYLILRSTDCAQYFHWV